MDRSFTADRFRGRLIEAERLKSRVLVLHFQGISPEGIADMVERVPDVVRGILRREGLLPGIRRADLRDERRDDRARVRVPAWVPTAHADRYREIAVRDGEQSAAGFVRRRLRESV